MQVKPATIQSAGLDMERLKKKKNPSKGLPLLYFTKKIKEKKKPLERGTQGQYCNQHHSYNYESTVLHVKTSHIRGSCNKILNVSSQT